MTEDKHITKWLKEGLINENQASTMLADLKCDREERTSGKLVAIVSTIGALLAGVGVILFVASNWQSLSRLTILTILILSSFGVSYAGYVLAYQKKNLPKVGLALFFLGTFLFGASIFLAAQMYNVQANSHSLVFLWLIGIIPLVYILQSASIAGLVCLLFFIWIGLYVSNHGFINFGFVSFNLLYVLSGLLVFEAGGLHYLKVGLEKVARIYRIIALKVFMIPLFFLTFNFYSHSYYSNSSPYNLSLTNPIIFIALIAAILAVLNLKLNPSHSSTWKIEEGISLSLIILSLSFYFYLYNPSSNIYSVFFNVVFAVCIAAIIVIGNKREDIRLVNIGLFYFALLVLARYFDFFWKLLPRSIFFLVGGVILICGGIFLERKRRELKVKFAK